MPAYKFEIFGVTALQFIAYIMKVAVMYAFAVVVVAQMHLDTYNKVKPLVSFIVRCAVSHIVLCYGQPAGVHIR